MEPGSLGVQRKFLERNGGHTLVERRSGLPFSVGVECVFGRDQRLITLGGDNNQLLLLSRRQTQRTATIGVGQRHEVRWCYSAIILPGRNEE